MRKRGGLFQPISDEAHQRGVFLDAQHFLQKRLLFSQRVRDLLENRNCFFKSSNGTHEMTHRVMNQSQHVVCSEPLKGLRRWKDLRFLSGELHDAFRCLLLASQLRLTTEDMTCPHLICPP